MKNKINSFFKRQWIVNVRLALNKVSTIPSLPSKIDKYYSHPLTRVLRVIGGIIAAIVILKKNTLFPSPLPSLIKGGDKVVRGRAPLDYISIYIALIQLLQIILISFNKVSYFIYLLIKFIFINN